MSDNSFPPVPVRTPISDSTGRVPAPWVQWFRSLYTRVGGAIAPTINEVSDQVIINTTTIIEHTTFIDELEQSTPVWVDPLQVEFLETQIRWLSEEVMSLKTQLDGIRQGIIS